MKNEIRKLNKSLRAQMQKFDVEQKSISASEAFLKSDIYKKSKKIMLYMPLGNEVDTSNIIESAISDGKEIIFPVTDSMTGEIAPFYAERDTKFSVGAFSVHEPVGTKRAEPEEIDVVIVPGIAFGTNGARIGFGKGCYDRFLANTNAVRVGCCYDFQLCDDIPTDAHDIPMDYLVTESGILKCNRKEDKYE